MVEHSGYNLLDIHVHEEMKNNASFSYKENKNVHYISSSPLLFVRVSGKTADKVIKIVVRSAVGVDSGCGSPANRTVTRTKTEIECDQLTSKSTKTQLSLGLGECKPSYIWWQIYQGSNEGQSLIRLSINFTKLENFRDCKQDGSTLLVYKSEIPVFKSCGTLAKHEMVISGSIILKIEMQMVASYSKALVYESPYKFHLKLDIQSVAATGK